MKISSLSVGMKNYQPSFEKRGFRYSPSQNPLEREERPIYIKRETSPVLLAATVGIVGIGIGLLIGSNKPNKTIDAIKNVFKKPTSMNDKATLALLALAGFGGIVKGEIDNKELEEKLDLIAQGKSPAQETQKAQNNDIAHIKRTQINSTVSKHSKYFHDVLLLEAPKCKNTNKYNKAIETIETIGKEKLTSTDKSIKINSKDPVIWSVTSEFAPIKAGGLGSVPPEIRNNAEKLGVNIPTFLPMYLNNGSASLSNTDLGYMYTYGKNEMPLRKVATIKMDVYRNGKSQTIPVNYYLHTDQDKNGIERQLIFIQADDYFDGGIYEATAKTEEPEKFAIMSKAVYEFAKLKLEGSKAAKDVEIPDKKAFNEIKQPDGMILNDWQASPTAALLRYKAPMENAYEQISDDTAKKLKDMPLITIGHNVMYQGSSQNDNDYYQKKATTSNILNTLFDKYSYDIVSHAKSGATEIDPEDEGLKVLDNVLLMEYENDVENYTNYLNMGITLSDYFNPVSENYAKELISPEHRELSYMLQWALVQKQKAGRLVGVINGNDYDNLNVKALLKSKIKPLTGVDFEPYGREDSTQEIKEKRLKNKIALYNEFALPFTESKHSTSDEIQKIKQIPKKPEFVQGKQGTTLPKLTQKEIEETPFFMSGGRLASQKGLDVLSGAIELLFKNWDEDFPNKPKPIFYIAGDDVENGTQRAIIENMKNNNLSKEDNDRVLFAHGWCPLSALMAGADFFLMPSKFEPCGLTQGESLALGTPVVASAVGGLVDTINRGDKFNGILTPKGEKLTVQNYYEAIKKSLNIFFNDKETYSKMIRDSIDEDFSWSKNGSGPVHDYLGLFGIER